MLPTWWSLTCTHQIYNHTYAVFRTSHKRKTNTLEGGVRVGMQNGPQLVLYSFVSWVISGSSVDREV